mmetsp:Transcript_98180/g.179366  ORF Transcript_98180/g.179366 Transcript_98180/m.179366 type:complete len:323 (+) Transcript_98180:193-1161(+)
MNRDVPSPVFVKARVECSQNLVSQATGFQHPIPLTLCDPIILGILLARWGQLPKDSSEGTSGLMRPVDKPQKIVVGTHVKVAQRQPAREVFIQSAPDGGQHLAVLLGEQLPAGLPELIPRDAHVSIPVKLPPSSQGVPLTLSHQLALADFRCAFIRLCREPFWEFPLVEKSHFSFHCRASAVLVNKIERMSQGSLVGEAFLCKYAGKLLTRDETSLVDNAAQAKCSEASEILPRPIQQLGHRKCCLWGKMVEQQRSRLVTVEHLEQLPCVTRVPQLLETFQELALSNAHVMMYIEATPEPHKATKFQSTPGMELRDSAPSKD